MNATPNQSAGADPADLTDPDPRAQRKELLTALRQARGSDVLIAYITSTRPGLEAQMAQDAIRFFFGHLPPEKVAKLDLVIHSNGGDGVVPWRLMTLLHEYAEKVDVLVPHRAFSAATLAALGAHEIPMHPMGMLGPIDASIVNPLGPTDPQGQQVAVSGEDVAAYYALVRDDLNIRHEEELVQAFRVLAEKVHPLVLGSVKRGSAQSRMLGEKLIGLHAEVDAQHLDLLEQLTTKLYYHGHPISRDEAITLGLPVIKPDDTVERALWDLYLAYETNMAMTSRFDPVATALSSGVEVPTSMTPQQLQWVQLPDMMTAPMVIVESEAEADIFEQDLQLSIARGPLGMYYSNSVAVRAEWVKNP
jgi:Serine dehydrogenase proteinase